MVLQFQFLRSRLRSRAGVVDRTWMCGYTGVLEFFGVMLLAMLVGLCGGCEPESDVGASRPLKPFSSSPAESAALSDVSNDAKLRNPKHAAQNIETATVSPVAKMENDRVRLVNQGRRAYTKYCIGCHGVDGDGKGESAGFLYPRPRDFTQANYKFSSTRSGSWPTDNDLRRTIREGLRGTAMPGWKLLPDRTIEALVVYIKHFSPKWGHRLPASEIPHVADPYRKHLEKAVAIARGEAVYHGYATCWSCHPAYVSTGRINEYFAMMENPLLDTWRTNLHESVAEVNESGEIIYPPDFRRDFVRAGMTIDDLYRAIAAGISGTAMPSWADSMTFNRSDGSSLVDPTDLWAMAYYVQSLIAQRPAKIMPADVIVRERVTPIILNVHRPVDTDDPYGSVRGTDLEGPEFFED